MNSTITQLHNYAKTQYAVLGIEREPTYGIDSILQSCRPSGQNNQKSTHFLPLTEPGGLA